MLKRTATILAAFVLAALAGSFAGALHPLGDSLAVFRLPLAGLAGALVLASGLARLWKWAAALACLAAAASVGWHKIAPPPPEPPGTLRLYQKNMFHQNADLDGLAADILAAGPDIVTLQEVSVENEALLDRLWAAYPHQHMCRYSARSAIAVLTRLEVAGAGPAARMCERRLGLAGLRVQTARGPVWALSLHLSWPWPLPQAGQVDRLERALAPLDAPAVIGGDFNMVAWSHTLARVARVSGTRRAGPSRPSFFLYGLPLPIDHVFAPGGGHVDTRPRLGGDHLGLLARIRPQARP